MTVKEVIARLQTFPANARCILNCENESVEGMEVTSIVLVDCHKMDSLPGHWLPGKNDFYHNEKIINLS